MHYCNVSPETQRYYFMQQGEERRGGGAVWGGAEKSFHPEYVNKIIRRHLPQAAGNSTDLNH